MFQLVRKQEKDSIMKYTDFSEVVKIEKFSAENF